MAISASSSYFFTLRDFSPSHSYTTYLRGVSRFSLIFLWRSYLYLNVLALPVELHILIMGCPRPWSPPTIKGTILWIVIGEVLTCLQTLTKEEVLVLGSEA
jgi:hypothetical protein